MSITQLHNSDEKGSSGGGAAASAGILFEQRLGALFAATILSGARLDARLGLGDASPTWLRFETEAPVDDLLVATTNGGFVAIQAKTTAALSREPRSPFGRTVEQFVRHWFTCRSGDGALGWNRPLDPSRDRLVLAVGSQAAASVRVDLPAALRLFSQPGGGVLTQGQQRAFEIFEASVRTVWTSLTAEPLDPTVLTDLARLVVVLTVDLDGADAVASAASLASALLPNVDATAVIAILGEVSGRLMARRGGGDLATFRQELTARGVSLSAPPRYRADIDALRRHSAKVAESLERYEVIEAQSGMPVTLRRDCQVAVENAALSGPLLIVGEPGAGKSGVLNALARTLRSKGQDVLELAVDRYSVETLEGLSRELHVEHGLLEVLDAWDGADPGWLIIDALDATRGGKGEGVFRDLIERVLERSGRWRVIASIRSFDLRMGQQFRQLFKGAPPVEQLADPVFSNVRHVHVPRWSDDEFGRLLALVPALSSALEHAPVRLRDLAKVPFNTRLLSELIARGALASNLNDISSQGELLQLYWQHRIEGHGLAAKACLRKLVEVMVEARALRAPTLTAGADPAMIDTLSREGVLIRVEGDRWVQFRHHLLFDFAAAQVLLEPIDLISGALRFPKKEARGLMLAPALGFILQEIWDLETNHARFWIAVGHLVADEAGDPIIRSAAGRLGAERPIAPEDALWLAERAAVRDERATTTLSHVSGALAVRIEDDGDVILVPWVMLASALAPSASRVAGTLRFLLHLLIDRVNDESLRAEIGRAGRALLAHGLTLADPGPTVSSAIGFVTDTYGTDREESRDLLGRLFTPERLQSFGAEEVPTLCYKISAIGELDPQFVARVFAHVYDFEVNEDRQTRLGSSQILSLTSNARQDYEMARYSLSEYFPHFLEIHPEQAIEAVIGAVDGYVARQHPISADATDHLLTVEDRPIRLRQDNSHIWAYDPDSSYSHDADLLIGKLLKRLRTAPEPEALALARLLRDKASLAVFWSRLFMAASERGDALVDELWPLAAREEFIMLVDTRKDAIDLIGKGVMRRSESERILLETAAVGFDFSTFVDPSKAKANVLRRLFTTIGRNNLFTETARAALAGVTDDAPAINERPLVIKSGSREMQPYDWIRDLDRQVPSNAAVIAAIEFAKTVLGLDAGDRPILDLTLDQAFIALDAIRDSLAPSDVHPSLRISAEGVIGQGCTRIVARKLLPPDANTDSIGNQTPHFLELLRLAARSKGPEVGTETEGSFESFASWSSPSPRVEATEAMFDLFLQRADLFELLQPDIESMLADPHPAVRLQAALRLVRFWGINRDTFWRSLFERLERETNLSVVEHLVSSVVGAVLHEDPQRTLVIIQDLLAREKGDPARAKRIRGMVCDQLAILWVTHHLDLAHEILQDWIAQPVAFADELRKVLSALRTAMVAGLADTDDKDVALRGRTLTLVANIVSAANRELEAHYARDKSTESQLADAKECAHLVDVACRELFFSTGASQASRTGQSELDRAGLVRFLEETEIVLERIGDYATPHTIYNLLQLLERLVPIDPGRVFDLTAHALQGGRRSGFQHESMGLDLLVRLIGVFLADHREIFEVEARRAKLIDSLEIFMEAGWPAARRLLYRLPELIQ